MNDDFNSYIDLKKEKPPFDVLVKAKGSDFMGDFWIETPVMRRLYKNPGKSGNRGWRWVTENGDRCSCNNDIDGWKWL